MIMWYTSTLPDRGGPIDPGVLNAEVGVSPFVGIVEGG